MSDRKNRRTKTFAKHLILLAAVLCLLLSCTAAAYAETGDCGENPEAEAGYGAWLTYWDAQSALIEQALIGDRLEELVCFEVFFDENGDWLIPEETRMMLDALRDSGAAVYVSLVNDVQFADGSVVQKSADLLETLLSDPAARSEHIIHILQLIRQLDVSGVELDYENMKSNTRLWECYAQFLGELFPVLEQNDIRLRAVMECQAPRYAEFPAGPEYICMCYNLYGYHSGPGPKADLAFLQQLGESWQSIPGEVRMAFATGGFLWADGAVARAMTEEEAAGYLALEGVAVERDAESGALTATWQGEQDYAVWYADGETLSVWRGVLQSLGYRHFDLFRLGGNCCASLTEYLK